MAEIKLTCSEEEARALIHAASVYGRELASDKENRTRMRESADLDEIRFALEKEVDKATKGKK